MAACSPIPAGRERLRSQLFDEGPQDLRTGGRCIATGQGVCGEVLGRHGQLSIRSDGQRGDVDGGDMPLGTGLVGKPGGYVPVPAPTSRQQAARKGKEVEQVCGGVRVEHGAQLVKLLMGVGALVVDGVARRLDAGLCGVHRGCHMASQVTVVKPGPIPNSRPCAPGAGGSVNVRAATSRNDAPPTLPVRCCLARHPSAERPARRGDHDLPSGRNPLHSGPRLAG